MRSFTAAISALGFAACISPAAGHEYVIGDLRIGHPWSRATPPGAEVGAGYLEVSNQGQTSDRLIGGSSDIAGAFEIHVSDTANGVARMRPSVPGVEIPADSQVALAPGGTHIMFVDLRRPFERGNTFRATLVFEKAGQVDVQFSVENIAFRPQNPSIDHGIHGAKP